MKIVKLEITQWRNFRNIEINISEDSTLVCLIGENGTGKSNLLELISAAANRFGISPGLNIPRGDPFSENHSFSISIKLTETLEELLPDEIRQQYENNNIEWNGVIRLISNRNSDGTADEYIIAEGNGDENVRRELANQIKIVLNQRKETNYLSLDSDRAYPALQIHPQHYAEALERDWDSPQFKKQLAFIPTRTMYDDWIKYFLAKETQDATKLQQKMRRAKENNEPYPEFVDGFEAYKDSVQKVLPHLKFVGVDSSKKTIVYDSAGLELKFTNLSGGEREIAFIIGQIERFQLQSGILLIDEPELHLNPDLLRNWLAYLRDTVDKGQVWVGTHSLEAVEAAGIDSTFVFERTTDTRIVENASSLTNRPILSVLSAAIGSPAFSIRNLRFVYIEGDRQGQEKERFYSIYGDSRFVRFIEGGGCNEVSNKLHAVRELAEDADEQIVTGGVIDRDFRTNDQIHQLCERTDLFVLGCHEIENLYLHPQSLQEILNRSGINENAEDIIKEIADRFAGRWILSHAVINSNDIEEETKPMKQVAGRLGWQDFEDNQQGSVEQITVASYQTGSQEYNNVVEVLNTSVTEYRNIRTTNNLWQKCMGKEVSSAIPPRLGLKNLRVLENQVLKIWNNGVVNPPQEVLDIKNYIDSLN